MTGELSFRTDEAWPRVSRETRERLDIFLDLFAQWSGKTNLVAASTRRDVVHRHIGDSLQLLRLVPEPSKWVDLGSGAGFPGLILAIAWADTSGAWVDLVESNRKKAAFLRAVVAATGAAASVHPDRIEAVYDKIPVRDRIASRALADLDQLLSLSEPWFRSNPTCEAWFHKGRDYRREIDEARGRWQFDLVEHPSAIEPDSVILQIANLKSM